MSAQERPHRRDDDLLTARLAPVPDAAPPYDGDPQARVRVPLAAALPAAGASPAAMATAGKASGVAATDRRGRDGAAGGGDDWPARFAQVLAEALAGSRPARQIIPWTTQRAWAHFRRIGPLLACGQRPRILRVVTSRPATDVMEMTVIAGFGPRTRALAVRFERTARHQAATGRCAPEPAWLCTDIETA